MVVGGVRFVDETVHSSGLLGGGFALFQAMQGGAEHFERSRHFQPDQSGTDAVDESSVLIVLQTRYVLPATSRHVAALPEVAPEPV